MRILHLEASRGWGGQEIRILNEAKGMRQRGHEIFFVVAKGAKIAKRAQEEGFFVREISFQKFFWMISFFRLAYFLLFLRIDIVNTHSSLDAWLGGIVGRLLRKAIIRTRHLSTPIRKGWNSRFLYNGLADFVVTTCSKVVPIICAQAKKDPFYCRSIPTGMDPNSLRYDGNEPQKFREGIGASSKDFLIGSVCMVRSWKGIEDFLKAADFLRNEKHLRWVIIGGGHLEEYQKKAREMGLESLVTFVGHMEAPFGAIAALDAFVLLSTNHEGVSQASLQAAFLKKPLITTPTGGLEEVCLPYVTGLQVPIFSPQKVAAAVLELKKNPELCKKLGAEGKNLVEKKFTFEEMLDRMEEIYRALRGQEKGQKISG